MVDIPANSSTTATLEGSSNAGAYSGVLETSGDHDWIRIDVLAGVTYQVSADLEYSTNDYDPSVTVRNAAGSEIETSVETGGVLQFTAGSAGSLYIDVSGFGPYAGERYDVLVNTQRSIEIAEQGSGFYQGSPGALVLGLMEDRSSPDDFITVGDLGIAFGRNGDDYIGATNTGGAIYGGSGEDTLFGGAGGDLIWGGQDDDDLDGQSGNDTLYGDQGQDLFNGEDGNDKIFGGDNEDFLQGNAGDDTLDGGSGADVMQGDGGNDTFFVGSADDQIVEGAGGGTDMVAARASYTLAAGVEVEQLRTTSNAGTTAINLVGNEYGQTIIGNAGANVLIGRGGLDTLTGLGGADAFVFDRAIATANLDHIVDFAHGVDKIRIDHTIFAAVPIGALAASAFKDLGASAEDSDDRVLYNHNNGFLYYDPDGAGGGGAHHFATLDNHAALTASDFLVIA